MQHHSTALSPRNDDGSITRPDFVLVGVQWADGQVAIYASKTLRRAELEYQVRFSEPPAWSNEFPRKLGHNVRIIVDMTDFVVIIADTYQQAFETLLNTWQPSTTPTKQIEQ